MQCCQPTDQQVALFDRDGAVTLDTPLTRRHLKDAEELMDQLLPAVQSTSDAKPHYRSGQRFLTEPAFVRIIEHPFFEHAAKKLLHSHAVVVASANITKTPPQPNTPFKILTEHTDQVLRLSDLNSIPRKMQIHLYIWLADVDDQCAPLMYRPGSHRQLAQHMTDHPQTDPLPWLNSNFVNVSKDCPTPVITGTGPDQWPNLVYADPVPCVDRAGQMTAVNLATIHSASTNASLTARKRLNIGFRPKGVMVGEMQKRVEARDTYWSQLGKVMSPDRQHLTRNDVTPAI